jgi:hypothetical protein
MGQIIELDQWRRRGRPAPAGADTGPLSWEFFPSTLVDAFVLPSIALWHSYVAACACWWLAPMGLVVRPAESSGSASARPRERVISTS